MREYTTQMDAARKGIITPELTKVAEKEHMREDELLRSEEHTSELQSRE